MMLLNIADILYELFTVELKYDAKICWQEVREKTMHQLNHKKPFMTFHQFSFASCKQTVHRKCKNAFNLKTRLEFFFQFISEYSGFFSWKE